MLSKLNNLCFKQVSIAPLIIFRLAFGCLLLYSTLRTFQKGWIAELYIQPTYYFSFVSWIKPLEGDGMYIVFGAMVLSALCITVGLLYRLNTVLFFLLFTYVELLDKAYYLNHYYLVSLLSFWLIWVPANRQYAVDTLLFPKLKTMHCNAWHIGIFRVQLSIVYFFAGLAKVNSDWLFKAQPLATWLPGKYQLPIIGNILHFKELAFVFSWAGCLYDLFIWVFLWLKKTRGIAYFFVILFHLLTAILFPRIGMFPFIMITSTIIFFSASWHQKVLNRLPFYKTVPTVKNELESQNRSVVSALIIVYFIVQLYLPLRYLQHSGNLFWHEQGYRFSWRVMLMEKNGYTSIILKDPKTKMQQEVDLNNYLSAFQKQQMRSQPDMMYQFAQYIGDEFLEKNGYAPEIYIKSRISLNGRRSQKFTDELKNIYGLEAQPTEDWILPL
tara:strand:+ start:83231 stop:84553 length:1323 start_codon:yes stop_codon:yes gene_type:complete